MMTVRFEIEMLTVRQNVRAISLVVDVGCLLCLSGVTSESWQNCSDEVYFESVIHISTKPARQP